MGSRSGDVDPSLIPFLIREKHMEMDAEKNRTSSRSRARSRPPVRLFRPPSSSPKKDYRSPTNAAMHPDGVICRFCEPERYSRLGLVGTSFSR
jgi:hypothetical protein